MGDGRVKLTCRSASTRFSLLILHVTVVFYYKTDSCSDKHAVYILGFLRSRTLAPLPLSGGRVGGEGAPGDVWGVGGNVRRVERAIDQDYGWGFDKPTGRGCVHCSRSSSPKDVRLHRVLSSVFAP